MCELRKKTLKVKWMTWNKNTLIHVMKFVFGYLFSGGSERSSAYAENVTLPT